MKSLSERLQGQEEKTLSDWVEASRELENTAAYTAFQNDRKKKKFLGIRMLDFCLRWASKKFALSEVSHPWFYQSVWEGVKLWANCEDDRSRDAVLGDTYTLLGQERAYGASHAVHNTGILPSKIQPSYDKQLGGLLPWMEVPRDAFGNQETWIPNDRVTRREVVREVVGYLRSFLKTHEKAIVLDMGGGNGELSFLLSQEKDLPENILIIVQEPESKMIDEGREKLRALTKDGAKKINLVFIQGNATENPFEKLQELAVLESDESRLASQYLDAPIGVAMSTFVIGAINSQDIPVVARKILSDMVPGGAFVIGDFADPTLRKKEFLEQTGSAGKFFFRAQPLFRSPLNTIYKNWGHNIGNMELLRKELEKNNVPFSVRWNMKTVTILPVRQKQSSVICIPLPGYAEMVLSGVKT